MKDSKNWLVVGLLLLNLAVFSHEVPAKTQKEKAEKELKRKAIKKAKIKKSTVWKFEVLNDQIDSLSRSKYFETTYNRKGEITQTIAYKEKNKQDVKMVYTYDQHHNLLTNIKYDSIGNVVEYVYYIYDKHDVVIEQRKFDTAKKWDTRFTYQTFDETATIVMQKFKPLDTLEYETIYQYEGPIEQGKTISVSKEFDENTLISRIESAYNADNQRILRSDFDSDNDLIDYYQYTYEPQSNRFSKVNRYTSDHKLISSEHYFYVSNGKIDKIITYNTQEKMSSQLQYEYDFYE